MLNDIQSLQWAACRCMPLVLYSYQVFEEEYFCTYKENILSLIHDGIHVLSELQNKNKGGGGGVGFESRDVAMSHIFLEFMLNWKVSCSGLFKRVICSDRSELREVCVAGGGGVLEVKKASRVVCLWKKKCDSVAAPGPHAKHRVLCIQDT